MSIRQTACPASFLGELHHCQYDTERGVWKCFTCGIGGNTSGFAKLSELEADLYRLQNEVEIARFELELVGRRAA